MRTFPRLRRALGTLAVAVSVLGSTVACAQIQELFSDPAPLAAEPVALSCPARPGTGALTLVVGARANSPTPVLPTSIAGLLRESSRTGQTVRVIQVDGAPKVTIEATFQTTAQSPEAQQNELNTFTGNLGTALGQIKPAQPEADVFQALRTAALATPAGGTIVLMDSGISTKGQLSFLGGDMLAAAQHPDEITGYLRANALLPDLTDRSVVLVGLGQTAEPQAELNEDLRTRVTTLWDRIASTAGAACTQSLVVAPSRQSVDVGGIGVTPVELPAEPVFRPCATTMLSDGGPVGFQGDVAVFRDEAAARTALQPLADQARRGNNMVRLVGTTASARTKPFRDQLSRDRAEAVKRILVSQGVDPARITTFGAGNGSQYHVPDVAPDGTLIPGPAAANRRVVVELSCG